MAEGKDGTSENAGRSMGMAARSHAGMGTSANACADIEGTDHAPFEMPDEEILYDLADLDLLGHHAHKDPVRPA